MGIVDGPSAMGYIFSVASPAHGLNPTWRNCFLPLSVLYSWAMYLAYIRFICGPPLPRRDVYWIPYMTYVMYVERSDRPPLFFLGHFKAMISKKSPEWAVDEKENPLCLDYRAQMIYNAAELGSPPLPEAEENRPARMREALFETLPGEKASLLPMEGFRKELFAGIAKNETIQRVLPARPIRFVGEKESLKDLQRLLVAVSVASWGAAGTPITWSVGGPRTGKAGMMIGGLTSRRITLVNGLALPPHRNSNKYSQKRKENLLDKKKGKAFLFRKSS
jgi:hypothetical protein